MKCRFLAPLLVVLAACTLGDTPSTPLDRAAQALEQHNSALFLAQVDLKALAASRLNTVAQKNPALNFLDKVGKDFGLPGVDQLLGNVLDVEGSLRTRLEEGVSTGELELQCQKATTPDCPWVAKSLREAQVKELTPDSAVARVTTPAGISSWLALRKQGETWKIVGQAPMEQQAATYAATPPRPEAAPAPRPKPGTAPAVPTPPKPASPEPQAPVQL